MQIHEGGTYELIGSKPELKELGLHIFGKGAHVIATHGGYCSIILRLVNNPKETSVRVSNHALEDVLVLVNTNDNSNKYLTIESNSLHRTMNFVNKHSATHILMQDVMATSEGSCVNYSAILVKKRREEL